MLEEVIRSKDPFSDPNQVARIEEQFQLQNNMLENVQAENKKLAETCAIMEQDIVKYQEKIKELKEQKKKSKILLVEK